MGGQLVGIASPGFIDDQLILLEGEEDPGDRVVADKDTVDDVGRGFLARGWGWGGFGGFGRGFLAAGGSSSSSSGCGGAADGRVGRAPIAAGSVCPTRVISMASCLPGKKKIRK